jgi:hypothetical protein
LSKTSYTYKDDYNAFQKFTDEVTGEKERRRMKEIAQKKGLASMPPLAACTHTHTLARATTRRGGRKSCSKGKETHCPTQEKIFIVYYKKSFRNYSESIIQGMISTRCTS